MYADKPSSSLETEQFRFRFEMAVDRTHSRAFICRRRRRRRRGRLNFGDPTKKVHAHKWPRAVENRKKHEFHAVHSCRSHTHFRESQGELRRGARRCGASRHHSRAGWMPSFLVWPHSNHVAKVAVSIPNHEFLSLYLGRARTKRPRPPRLLLRQKSSLSHKNPSCPLSLPFFLYSPLCKLLHFDANLIPFLSVSISC